MNQVCKEKEGLNPGLGDGGLKSFDPDFDLIHRMFPLNLCENRIDLKDPLHVSFDSSFSSSFRFKISRDRPVAIPVG